MPYRWLVWGDLFPVTLALCKGNFYASNRPRNPQATGSATVIHPTKNGKDRKVFDAPEWPAAMCCHVPNPGEQMVRYYGWYGNVTRGKRQKRTEEGAIPYIIESDRSPAVYRKKLGQADSEDL
jgi:hypothetical protein